MNNDNWLRLRIGRQRSIAPNLVKGAALIFLSFTVFVSFLYDKTSFPHYTFEKRMASNGVELYTLRTAPDDIQLEAIDKNVTATKYTGVNGGFFWEGALLSIAVMNGRPLKGEPGDYGSGWYNTGVDANLKRGTLVWDEAAKRFSVQIVTDAGELTVTDKQRYWAQGGVSMGLANESGWQSEIVAEQMPSYDQDHMRTALAYDRNNRLYMIVTPTLCTIDRFRNAIKEKVGGGQLVDGVFLDGDGSSQMRSRYAKLVGDSRPVHQMLAVVR